MQVTCDGVLYQAYGMAKRVVFTRVFHSHSSSVLNAKMLFCAWVLGWFMFVEWPEGCRVHEWCIDFRVANSQATLMPLVPDCLPPWIPVLCIQQPPLDCLRCMLRWSYSLSMLFFEGRPRALALQKSFQSGMGEWQWLWDENGLDADGVISIRLITQLLAWRLKVYSEFWRSACRCVWEESICKHDWHPGNVKGDVSVSEIRVILDHIRWGLADSFVNSKTVTSAS